MITDGQMIIGGHMIIGSHMITNGHMITGIHMVSAHFCFHAMVACVYDLFSFLLPAPCD